MKTEWFAWYPTTYKADTQHLTAEQDGIYRRLIDHYMETRVPLPNNDIALARIAGITQECWNLNAEIVRAFFHSKAEKLIHKFCDRQLDSQDRKSKTMSEIGKMAAEKRWNKQEVKYQPHTAAIPNLMPNDAIREEKRRDKIEISPFLDSYKTILAKTILKISPERKKGIERFAAVYKLEEFNKALEKVRDSEFLQKWGGADIDWICKEENFIKIMEGKYNKFSPEELKIKRPAL